MYFQLVETIRRRIIEGEYEPGQFIPSSKELQIQFNVSDITIRKALNALVKDGYIIRKQGQGTLVTERKHEKANMDVMGNFRELLDIVTGKPVDLEIEVLDIEVTKSCPPDIRKKLSLNQNEKVWRMKRIRKNKGKPLSYFVNYGRPEHFEGIKKPDIEKTTFVELAPKVSGISFSRVEQVVEATLTDVDLSQLLATNFGDPVFFVTNTYYSTAEIPIAITAMYLRGDRYKYHAIHKIC